MLLDVFLSSIWCHCIVLVATISCFYVAFHNFSVIVFNWFLSILTVICEVIHLHHHTLDIMIQWQCLLHMLYVLIVEHFLDLFLEGHRLILVRIVGIHLKHCLHRRLLDYWDGFTVLGTSLGQGNRDLATAAQLRLALLIDDFHVESVRVLVYHELLLSLDTPSHWRVNLGKSSIFLLSQGSSNFLRLLFLQHCFWRILALACLTSVYTRRLRWMAIAVKMKALNE